MTVPEALAQTAQRWPTAHGDDEALPLILQAENIARTEVLGQPVLSEVPDGALSIPAPYDMAYVHFAAALLAQMDGVYERYNAELALYNALYLSWACAHRREHLPPRGAEVTAYG